MPLARILLWVTTTGALTLTAKSWFSEPPPLTLVLALIAFYLLLLAAGMLYPRWQMYADVLDRGPEGRGLVALTFDDGPDPTTTPEVLRLLAEADQRATFFVIGHKVEQHRELTEQIVAAGHELALHGYAHARLTAMRSPRWIAADIERARQLLEPIQGRKIPWYRPPIGHVSPRTASAVERSSVVLTCWTVRGLDGVRGAVPDKVAARVARGLRDGAIVMLHDAAELGGRRPAGVTALPEILKELKARGWRSVTLTELLPWSDSGVSTPVKP